MPAVDGDAGAITAPLARAFVSVRNGFTAFANEDVIVAKITPCFENGKAALCRGLTNGLGFGSTEFHVLRCTDAVIPEYVYQFVRQESFRRDGEANMTGSVGQKRVPADWLKAVEIPLAPLAEQRRIVAKVDAVLARVNAARQRLGRVPAVLKRFRQSILAAACSGRLTASCRGGTDNVPEGWKASTLGESYKLERGRFLARPRNDPQFFGGSQPNINLQTLSPYQISLPPLAEQHEIVRRVEALFGLADKIEGRVTAATARADKLIQATLAKAFRGELVPTEAELAELEGREFETAQALLDRIHDERNCVAPSPGRNGSRRSASVPRKAELRIK